MGPVVSRVVVVEEQDNPSSAFFVLPALARHGHPVERMSLASPPSPEALHGAIVLLVRYVSPQWMAVLEAARPHLAGLIFFMDDDVLDPAASKGTPPRYRYKLWRLAARHAGWLATMGARMWVSTSYLQKKYAVWKPVLVPPAAPEQTPGAMPGAMPDDIVRVFYHGTASHLPELRWLRPVVASLLKQAPQMHMELTAPDKVAKWYRGLPRVTIVRPMPWPAYWAFAGLQGRHIGLAPLLPEPFNLARSHTKFYDITRSGAVGVYAAGSACAQVVDHGVDGLVVPMIPDAWEEAVLSLAHDAQRRQAMLRAAQDKAATLDRLARSGEVMEESSTPCPRTPHQEDALPSGVGPPHG